MQNTKAYMMLVCATLFWAGNFMVGKYAFLVEIPPLTLVFYRWLLVWIILLPFTFKEIFKYKDTILNNLPLLFFLGFTSVGLFNSFTYLSLIHTQVINASLFNTAIPAIIILLCFLFKVEQTPHVITPPIIIKSPLLKFRENKMSNLSLVIIAKIPHTEIIRPKI